MNYNRIRRLINEYLDGEIGLADKAQLEEIMADNPRVREEYERLRRMGSLMGLVPEVRVHPYRFRAKLNAAMDGKQRSFFTPQRAFSAAMLVVTVVFVLTFGLYAYQQQVINRSTYVSTPAQVTQPAASAASETYVVQTGVGAEQFFSRLALEHQVGMLDERVLVSVMNQTRVYEGATCPSGATLAPLTFPRRLPRSVTLVLMPEELTALTGVAQELSGYAPQIRVGDGEALNPGQVGIAGEPGMLTVQLNFN